MQMVGSSSTTITVHRPKTLPIAMDDRPLKPQSSAIQKRTHNGLVQPFGPKPYQ